MPNVFQIYKASQAIHRKTDIQKQTQGKLHSIFS